MLRVARKKDIAFIEALQARPEFRSMIAEDSAARLAEYIREPVSHLLIWERAGRPAGFVLIDHPAESPHRAELVRLCLDRPGQGEGQAMIAATAGYAFDTLQADRLWLDVAADNTRARRAYEKAGFTHEGTLRGHWLRRTGDRADLALYGLMRSDWRAQH